MGCVASSKKCLETIEQDSREAKDKVKDNEANTKILKYCVDGIHKDILSSNNAMQSDIKAEFEKTRVLNNYALNSLENMNLQFSELKQDLRFQMKEASEVESNIQHVQEMTNKLEETIKASEEEEEAWAQLPLRIVNPINNLFLPMDTLMGPEYSDLVELEKDELPIRRNKLLDDSKTILQKSKAPYILHIVGKDGAEIERYIDEDNTPVCVGTLECGTVIEAFRCVNLENGTRKFRIRPYGWVYDRTDLGSILATVIKENPDYDSDEGETSDEEEVELPIKIEPPVSKKKSKEVILNQDATVVEEKLQINLVDVGDEGLGVFVVAVDIAVVGHQHDSSNSSNSSTPKDADDAIATAISAGAAGGIIVYTPEEQKEREKARLSKRNTYGHFLQDPKTIAAHPISARMRVIGFKHMASGKQNPSLAAGLRENDIIEEVNGFRATSLVQLIGMLQNVRGTVKIGILRTGTSRRAYNAHHMHIKVTGVQNGLGIIVDKSDSGMFRGRKISRVHVYGLRRMKGNGRNPCEIAGIRPGDIIEQVNGQSCRTRQQLINLLQHVKGTVFLTVLRDTSKSFPASVEAAATIEYDATSATSDIQEGADKVSIVSSPTETIELTDGLHTSHGEKYGDSYDDEPPPVWDHLIGEVEAKKAASDKSFKSEWSFSGLVGVDLASSTYV